MQMRRALLKAATAAISVAIVAGPLAVAGHSAAPLCAGVEKLDEWSRIPAPSFSAGPAEISDYAIDPLNPLSIAVTNGAVVRGSNDGGCSWDELFALDLLPSLDKQVSSLNTTITHLAVPAAPEGQGERSLYLVLEESVGGVVRPHLARSPDGGKTWVIHDDGLPLIGGGVFDLSVAPSNAEILYLLLRDDPASGADTTYASHNGGVTWEERSTNASEGVATQMGIDPLDPAVIWYWGGGGLYRSSNGGVSRSSIRYVDPSVSMVDVQHLPGSPTKITAYEAETQTFIVSTDGGTTWTRFLGPPMFSHAMTHGPAGQVLVAGHQGVYQLVGSDFWHAIHREEQPDLYNLQATAAGDGFVFGLSTENAIERYDALDATVKVDPFQPLTNELIGGTTELAPRRAKVKLDPGGSEEIQYQLALPAHPRPLDVFFLVDTSMSMDASINGLRAGMQQIIDDLEAARIDVQFGVGEYKDYPIPGYGDPHLGDFPYRLNRVIGPADAGLADALEKLESSGGGNVDLPESQLTGLYQAATGFGDAGFVPPGHDASFRPAALKVIVHITDAQFHNDAAHPSPPFSQVAEALRLRGILQIGLAVYGRNGPDGLTHLTQMAEATDTRAPSPVDCDNDGEIDVPAGQPLACVIATEQSAGVLELAPAIVASLRAVTEDVSVQLQADDQRFVGGIAPTVYPSFNVLDAGELVFDVTYSCPRHLAGERSNVRLAAMVAGRPVAHGEVTIVCRPLPEKEKDKIVPPFVAATTIVPRFLVPAPPPPPPPITESAPGTQQMFQAQPAAAAQEQEELQTAVAWQEAVNRELAEEYSFTSTQRRDPSPWFLYASALLMGAAWTVVSRPVRALARRR